MGKKTLLLTVLLATMLPKAKAGVDFMFLYTAELDALRHDNATPDAFAKVEEKLAWCLKQLTDTSAIAYHLYEHEIDFICALCCIVAVYKFVKTIT